MTYMVTATPIVVPKRAESIRDVVAPQRFDSVQLWLELPPDAKVTERFFYENLPSRVGGSRAGGGSYPTLDICIDRQYYQKILEELKKNSRLIHSVVFQVSSGGSPWPTPVEVYLLQGTETLKTDLI